MLNPQPWGHRPMMPPRPMVPQQGPGRPGSAPQRQGQVQGGAAPRPGSALGPGAKSPSPAPQAQQRPGQGGVPVRQAAPKPAQPAVTLSVGGRPAQAIAASIPVTKDVALAMNLEKASLIELLAAERAKAGKQAAAIVELVTRTEALEKHATLMESQAKNRAEEGATLGKENAKNANQLEEVTGKLRATEQKLQATSSERDKEKSAVQNLTAQMKKIEVEAAKALEVKDKTLSARIANLEKEHKSSKTAASKLGDQLTAAVKERETAMMARNNMAEQLKALSSELQLEAKTAKAKAEQAVSAQAQCASARKELAEVQKSLHLAQADRDKAMRMSSEAKAQVVAMTSKDGKAVDEKVAELAKQVEKEAEARLAVEEALRSLVAKNKMTEADRDAEKAKSAEVSKALEAKELELKAVAATVKVLGEQLSEGKIAHTKLEESLRCAQEDLAARAIAVEQTNKECAVLQEQVAALQASLASVEQSKSAAEGTIKQLETGLEASRAEAAAQLDAEMRKGKTGEREAEIKVKELSEKLEDASKRAATLTEERDADRKQVLEMSEKMQREESLSTERLKGWEEYKAKADTLTNDLAVARQTIEDTETLSREAAKAADAQQKKMSGDMQALQANLQQVSAERDQLRTQKSEVTSDRDAARKQIETLKANMIGAENSAKAEQGKISQALGEAQAAAKKAAEAARLELLTKDKKLQATVDELEKVVKRGHEQDEQLRAAAKEADECAKAIKVLKADLDGTQKQGAAASGASGKKIDELTKELAKAAEADKALKKQVSDANAKIEQLSKDKALVARQLEDLKIQVQTIGSDSVKTLGATKAAAEERIKKAEEAHRAEMTALQQRMDKESKKAAEDAKKALEAVEQRNTQSIKIASDKAGGQQQQLQTQLAALDKQMRSTGEMLALEKKQHAEAQVKLKTLEQSLRKAGEEHASQITQLKAAQEKQAKQLQQELQTASQRSQKEANDTAGVQQQLARLNEQHSVAQKQVRHLEGLVQGLEGEKKRLREQLDSLSGNAHSEKGVMTKQLEALGAKLSRTQDECRNLSAQVEQLRLGVAKESEEKKQLLQVVERAKQDQVMLQQVKQELSQVKMQSQGLGQQSMQLHAEKAAATGQLEEIQKQFKKERDVLHQQLSEANSKLSMAAEALRISGQQVAEITSLEQQLRATGKQREEDKMKIVSMEAQLNQTSSGSRVQIDRANERIQAYERALFDSRQSLASKDSRIAELESSVSRLHQAASRASGISPGNNYRSGSGGDR
eukprot:CAMPEP_0173385888 /NCGR_PEP_ID=MMETSP1356-20130122/8482_1 /TAXON_ID=77927 ORGANISM="Hemiselmis virescens, Strain PCC157" /NCGR_SAMPLE_ID=MMETSP1356 /ASSEMBLY_ACC=CAM_ASM_000847 /LENGTH=1265 /DNA_ID=CAMNT_0014341893 /DNA_START=61 /DNA_END=3855 /DNA_ORIENTATION=+